VMGSLCLFWFQIHERGLSEFTAHQLIGGEETVRIGIDEQIPSEPQINVIITPISPIDTPSGSNGDNNTPGSDAGWVWKIENSAISYHPGYRGHFAPRWDD